MDLFSYCYNIAFILVFAVSLSSCFTAYGVTKQKIFRWYGILLLVYIFDSVVIALFSVLKLQQSVLLVYYAVLAFFTGAETYALGRIVYTMFGREGKRQAVLAALGAVVFAAIGIGIGGKAGWFLDMTVFNFAMLALCGIYWRLLQQARETPAFETAAAYQKLMWTQGIFSALAILENVLYLAGASAVIDEILPAYRNHICLFSDCFTLLLSLWLILFSRKAQDAYISRHVDEALQQRMSEFQTQALEKQRKLSAEQVEEFGRCYGLTDRETEILQLILEGKSNQEIGQALYITIGTVKTHIHSIFGKLEVSRRAQLLSRFVNHNPQ